MSLSKILSDHTDKVSASEVTTRPVFDFKSAVSSKLVVQETTFTGVSYFDQNETCVATASFRDQIEVEDLQVSTTCENYAVTGMLTGDYELLCTVFRLVGVNVIRPCLWCKMKRKRINIFLFSSKK